MHVILHVKLSGDFLFHGNPLISPVSNRPGKSFKLLIFLPVVNRFIVLCSCRLKLKWRDEIIGP